MYARKFTLRQTVEEVSELAKANGPKRTRFGVCWYISVERKETEEEREYQDEPLIISLNCGTDARENPWSVSFNATLRIKNRNGKDKIEDSVEGCFNGNQHIDFNEQYDWGTLVKQKFIKNDKMTVEVDVVIKEMKGFAPKRIRNFDASEEHLTDVVLIVGNRKFNVLKAMLANFSDYFKALFFNGCKESEQSEISLQGVDPDIFQMLLEVIYGELDCIQGETVEDILQLANQYQVEVATRRCVDFMINKAYVPLEKQFRLASAYSLLDLQDHLLEGIKSRKDSDDRLKKSAKDMSDAFIAKLIRKIYE